VHWCKEQLNVAASSVGSIDELAKACDIIITTTPTQTPLLSYAQLQKGQHVTAMGSDAPTKAELSDDVASSADVFVVDHLTQSQKLGELRLALANGRVSPSAVFPSLGSVVSGRHKGRTQAAQITVCDLTGTGVQDTAIAHLAYQRALQSGMGTLISRSS